MDLAVSGVQEILIIFAVSSVVVVIFHFLRQPALAGFLLSGALVGPNGFGWIQNHETSSHLAEIGIIFLLFSLGVEFSLKQIRPMRRAFFGLGGLQCILTTLTVMGIGLWLGFDWKTSFVWGSILSLSSTAVILKLLHQRRETVTPHGQTAIAVLLFQDLWIIPLMIVLPLLANDALHETLQPTMILMALGKGVAIALGVIVSSKFIVPNVLRIVAVTQMKELFLIVVLLLSVGSAFITAKLGLSLALGAFMAGVIISESEYGHEAVADLLPFREIFMALFFVSAGMLLDYRFLLDHWALVVGISLAVLLIKFGITASIASLLGFGSRLSALVALILAQIGEFSFVVTNAATNLKLITTEHSQTLLSVTLLLMATSPVLLSFAQNLAPFFAKFDPFRKIRRSHQNLQPLERHFSPLNEHVVIIGYGHNGQTLAAILKKTQIPFSVIEANHNLYQVGVKAKHAMIYGDASHLEILEEAHIATAKMAVIAINDRHAVRRIALKLRKKYPHLYIMARCHYIQEAEAIKKIGLSDIVIGEFEMSIEIFARVLRHMGYPTATIEEEMIQLQNEDYKSIRQTIGH